MNEPNMEWKETATMKAGDVLPVELVVPVNIVKILISQAYEKGKAEERERIFSGSADIRQPRKLINDNK